MGNVLLELWTAWEHECLEPPDDGLAAPVTVIETRWVRYHPDCPGWNPWQSAGIIDGEGEEIEWLQDMRHRSQCNPTILEAVTAQEDIARAIKRGEHYGTIVLNDLHLQWRLRDAGSKSESRARDATAKGRLSSRDIH